MVWRSARISSVVMVSMSPAASTDPSTRVTSGSAKARVTWQIASASRMLARNLLPRPSPSLAPFTMPAMSTNETVAGSSFWLPNTFASSASRGSGSGTTPTLGSMVADGQFAAWTSARVRAWKRGDLPTLGRPTIPIVRATGGDSTGRRRSSGSAEGEPLVSPLQSVGELGLVGRRLAEDGQGQASQRGARDPRVAHHDQQAGTVRRGRRVPEPVRGSVGGLRRVLGHGPHLEPAQRAVVAMIGDEPSAIRGLHGAGHRADGAQRCPDLRIERLGVRAGEPGELLAHELIALARLGLGDAGQQHQRPQEHRAPDRQGDQQQGEDGTGARAPTEIRASRSPPCRAWRCSSVAPPWCADPMSGTQMLLLGLILGAALGALASWLVMRERARVAELRHHSSADSAGQLLRLADERHERDVARRHADAEGALRSHLSQLAQRAQSRETGTSALTAALRAPTARGRWGEVQLRRIVEAAGMLEHVDFTEQLPGTRADGEKGQRPDLVVHLAGDRPGVIDATAAMDADLSATEEPDPARAAARRKAHAKALRHHVGVVSSKAYWKALGDTPEFTVLFVPSDGVLAAALETDPELLEDAFARDVVIASPA